MVESKKSTLTDRCNIEANNFSGGINEAAKDVQKYREGLRSTLKGAGQPNKCRLSKSILVLNSSSALTPEEEQQNDELLTKSQQEEMMFKNTIIDKTHDFGYQLIDSINGEVMNETRTE